MIRCDKCGGATLAKKIKSKKDGKEYEILECRNGCKSGNGRFAYSFFPPKPKEEKQPAGVNGQAVNVLSQILQTLNRIETILANPNRVNVSGSELQPDEEAPF
jgi:hypothetical protein